MIQTPYCNIDQCVNEYIINEELHKLTKWLGANKLALNISKTKYMIFHTSNRKITYPNLKINNVNIERVTQFNFLGVMFNTHMDWSRHINYISMKINILGNQTYTGFHMGREWLGHFNVAACCLILLGGSEESSGVQIVP